MQYLSTVPWALQNKKKININPSAKSKIFNIQEGVTQYQQLQI